MFRVAVAQLQPGMRVGRSVLDASGRILLTAGTVLREGYIERLRRLGIPAVYIWNELAPDVEPRDVVSDESRIRLTQELRTTMGNLRQALEDKTRFSARRWVLAADRVRDAVNTVIDEILGNRHALISLQDIRSYDEYTLGHSVNVCVLSTLIGASLGFNTGQLRDMGMGAVLHDIGKLTVPAEILNKPGALSPEENAEMQKHTDRGFEILRQQPEISLLSAHVAWQHHERWNGMGYPRGLRGSDIQEFARIVAVADVYDAMTADRPYRKGYTPDRALRNMRDVISDWFEPRVLNAFMENIALYPVGTLVELTSGEIGVVVDVTRGQADRPRVRVVKDPYGRTLSRSIEINLATDRSYAVARVLVEPEDRDPARQLQQVEARFG